MKGKTTWKNVFAPRPNTLKRNYYNEAYQLKIELKDTGGIWCRVIIPTGVTFYRVFDTIQRTMGWLGDSLDEYHLYEFDNRYPCLQSHRYLFNQSKN